MFARDRSLHLHSSLDHSVNNLLGLLPLCVIIEQDSFLESAKAFT